MKNIIGRCQELAVSLPFLFQVNGLRAGFLETFAQNLRELSEQVELFGSEERSWYDERNEKTGCILTFPSFRFRFCSFRDFD